MQIFLNRTRKIMMQLTLGLFTTVNAYQVFVGKEKLNNLAHFFILLKYQF